MELAKMVRSIRGQRTQVELAQSLGVTKQQVCDWEHGRYKPNSEQLKRLGITRIERYELEKSTTRTVERDEYAQA
jgi:DNA-binding transcriptional regulator YiaG